MVAFFVFCVVPVVMVAGLIIWGPWTNRQVVENEARERVVIKNPFTGTLRVLGQGTHLLAPWWAFDTRVALNKDPMGVDQVALTSDGVKVVVKVRFDELTGRKFDLETGQLEGDGNVITDESVLFAVTLAEYPDRDTHVRDRVSRAIDQVIGGYTHDELFRIDPTRPVSVPKQQLEYGLDPVTVSSRRELLEKLAVYLQHESNYRLRMIGHNVDEVGIIDLHPEDASLQQSLEKSLEMRNLRRAVEEVQVDGLSNEQKAAFVSGNFGDALWSDAVKKAAENLADGLKNWGRGGGQDNQ
jgi:hypothetical protein